MAREPVRDEAYSDCLDCYEMGVAVLVKTGAVFAVAAADFDLLQLRECQTLVIAILLRVEIVVFVGVACNFVNK